MSNPGATVSAAGGQTPMTRFGRSYEQMEGWMLAVNVALGTTIVWHTLHALNDTNPLWAIASMIAASDPQPGEARRMFKCRLANVAVGGAMGLIFLIVGGPQAWVLPLALAATVLVSMYLVRIKTMWRQAPITAALVIAAALTANSASIGVTRGFHKMAEVVFGSLVGILVSLVLSRVRFVQPAAHNT
jgi:hypothetical protein